MSADPSNHECFTDFALEEYVAGRLDAEVRAELIVHVAGCDPCRRALRAFESESALLRSVLGSPVVGPNELREVSDETLGLYLSGALGDAEASPLEEAISRQPGLLARLVALAREVVVVKDSSSLSPCMAHEPPVPVGRILKMPRRTSQPVTVSVVGKQAGGMGY